MANNPSTSFHMSERAAGRRVEEQELWTLAEPDVFLDALPRADAPAAVPAHGSAFSGGLNPPPGTRSLLLGDSVGAERPEAVEGRPHPPVSAAGNGTEPPRSPNLPAKTELAA